MLSLAIVAYLASGMFLHLSYERYLWVLLALAASAAWLGKNAPEPDDAAAPPDAGNGHGATRVRGVARRSLRPA